jgi:hypothetical protein
MKWTSTDARNGSFILTNPEFSNIHISIFTGMRASLPHASNITHSHHFNGSRYWTSKKANPNKTMRNKLMTAFKNWEATKNYKINHRQKPTTLEQLIANSINSNNNSNSNNYTEFRI